MNSSAALTVYSKRAIRLHWISALVILTEWPLGKFGLDGTGTTTDFTNALHIWLGVIALGLTLARIASLVTEPRVKELPMPTWGKWLFKINHLVIYVALLGCSLTGVGMLTASKQLPPFTGSARFSSLEDTAPAGLHEPFANILMNMVVIHVAGVDYYQVLHGRTLRRMGISIAQHERCVVEMAMSVGVAAAGLVGASIAWWLSNDPDFDGSITVIERDPTCATASTSHTNSYIRQQFSNPLNIAVSQFGLRFIDEFRSELETEVASLFGEALVGHLVRRPILGIATDDFPYFGWADTPELEAALGRAGPPPPLAQQGECARAVGSSAAAAVERGVDLITLHA